MTFIYAGRIGSGGFGRASFRSPSREVDILWVDKKGSEDWVEIGGCDMVDPNVFDAHSRDEFFFSHRKACTERGRRRTKDVCSQYPEPLPFRTFSPVVPRS